jgi:hypothetical protein
MGESMKFVKNRNTLRLFSAFLTILFTGFLIILMETESSHQRVVANTFSSAQNKINGPLRINLTNPRYFTDDSGEAIFLTGSHTWANFQNAGYSNPPPDFDYSAYLDFLQDHQHNFFRFWVWEQSKWAAHTSEDIWFSPSLYQRTGPGIAIDGGQKFDLTKFNQSYFDRMRSRIIEAGNRGFYVSIMLFNGFSVGRKNSSDPGNPWPGHPYNLSNNINGINGDPNNDGNGYEIDTLSISGITELQEAYVRKVIDTVNDLDNVLYEICNECNQDSAAWQYHMINYIKGYEATKTNQHPVGMSVAYPNGSNTDLFNSPADWVSPNSDGGYQENPPASNGNKVINVDTDHLWGIGGDREWFWKSFTRGLNPIFMDCYNAYYCEGENPNNPTWVSLRKNMGYGLAYANRMNLEAMIPHADLCSTGYCLANAVQTNAEYLIYLPNGGQVNVNLSSTPGELAVEWLNPENGKKILNNPVEGGGTQSFIAPFSGDAVLYLTNQSAPVFSNAVWLPVILRESLTTTNQLKYFYKNPLSFFKMANLSQ